jgi:hypothetical protein
MLIRPLDCLEACDKVYYDAPLCAGPLGRDGANLYQQNGALFLVFRGTLLENNEASILDWFNDLDYGLLVTDLFPGRVHRGFYRSFLSLRPLIEKHPLWQASEQGQCPLICSGHSKGGALACLAAWVWRKRNPLILTFGSPRIGDKDFVAAWNEQGLQAHHYVNPFDPIPHLPLWKEYQPLQWDCAPPTIQPAPYLWENHHLNTGYRPWIATLPTIGLVLRSG